jgi:pimeloyl-ACP methyl ester carboxylesterase
MSAKSLFLSMIFNTTNIMNIKYLKSSFHYLTPLLSLIFFPLFLLPQTPIPPNWDDIIAARWYTGKIVDKTVFVYLDTIDPSKGYFFVADKALPEVNNMAVKWKKSQPRSISFNVRGNSFKVKFAGYAEPDTISGYIKTSRKTASRLGISSETALFMEKESPCYPPSPPPCYPASLPPRYSKPIFPNVGILDDISYGAATGYYVSMPVETKGYDYQQIILDAMEKMYLNPTKEAILHILNKDPVSFAITDLQALRLDIYQPVGDMQGNRPLILLLHGGAFLLGDKATPTIQEIAYDLASKGYVVASANYRMGFNPASKSSLERSAYRAVQDARAALRYLSANAATYRIDPNFVFLAGSSAGAITALNVAFMKEDERPESSFRNLWRAQIDLGGLDESTNKLPGNFRVRAVVNLWGAVNDTNIIDRDERIPVLSIHGDADKIVPYNHSYPFMELDTMLTGNIVSKLYGSAPIHRRLQNLGIHSELVALLNTGHEPQYEPGKYRMVMDTVLTRTTDFYFRSMFNFPELSGPHQVAKGMTPPLYSLPLQEEISYYWQVTGGKILPGSAKNAARVVWLAEKEGVVSLLMVHSNGANSEMRVPVQLP